MWRERQVCAEVLANSVDGRQRAKGTVSGQLKGQKYGVKEIAEALDRPLKITMMFWRFFAANAEASP